MSGSGRPLYHTTRYKPRSACLCLNVEQRKKKKVAVGEWSFILLPTLASSWSVWWSNLIVPGSLVVSREPGTLSLCTRSRSEKKYISRVKLKKTGRPGILAQLYPARWSPTSVSHCSRRNIRTPDHHLPLTHTHTNTTLTLCPAHITPHHSCPWTRE